MSQSSLALYYSNQSYYIYTSQINYIPLKTLKHLAEEDLNTEEQYF